MVAEVKVRVDVCVDQHIVGFFFPLSALPLIWRGEKTQTGGERQRIKIHLGINVTIFIYSVLSTYILNLFYTVVSVLIIVIYGPW